MATVTGVRNSIERLRDLGISDEALAPAEKWLLEVVQCWHESLDGIDQTPFHDPSKRWQCMACGLIGTDADFKETAEDRAERGA